MAKQTINIGTGELTGNGESIRSAFSKINNNFDELYSSGSGSGYVGSQGLAGELGYTGSEGVQGIIGYTGSTGALGYTGSVGVQGIIGYTGSTGVIGYTGSTGPVGYTGSAAGLPIPESKTYNVSLNGNDSNDGFYTYTAFRTLKHALSQASSGDIIKISAGLYVEEFPLVVPSGVSVKGSGLRSTEIKPTTATNSVNCFLLNGESTVEDLTIRDMFYNGFLDTGYAFTFNTTTNIFFRSPYVQRVTVLNRGSNPTLNDPYGFLSGDAGRGALLDGSKVSRESLHAAMLFNEVTFIVPNSRGIIMTNGARSEFLNCFTYFADLAIEGKTGIEGRGNNGKTYIGLENITGSFSVGDTIDYYSSVGQLIASYTIESIRGSTYVIDGTAAGFATFDENRKPKTVISVGDAFTTSTNSQYGGESLYLDGDGDLLRITESVINQSGPFTVEGWFFTSNVVDLSTLFFLKGAAGVFAGVRLDIVNSQLKLSCSSNGYAWEFESLAGTVYATTWHHVAIQRSGNNFILHLDGNVILTESGVTSFVPLFNGYINNIGASNNQNYFNGYIDEIRISNIARYQSNSFTLPLNPHVNDNNVELLLHFNGTTTDDDGPIIQDIRSSGGATATRISRYDRSEFAAELRAFSCANVYGNQGVKADGPDVKLNLIAHNFGYIGTGFDLTNDRSAVLQANEVIETNEGRVYYDTVDQDGNYRIGDLFTVNFETGNVTFQGPNFDVSSLTGINFTDGSNSTKVNPAGIETGNLVLGGNTLGTTIGNINLDPGANAFISLNGPTYNSGGVTIDGKFLITAPVPLSSVGTLGDVPGLIAFSDTHIYRCTGTWDGVTHIWKRISWSGDTW